LEFLTAEDGLIVLAFLSGLLIVPTDRAAAEGTSALPLGKPVIAKICLNCHQAQENSIRGTFDNVAFKTHSIQLKIDDAVEILKFDEKTLQVDANGKTEGAEALRNIKKGHEVRLTFIEKNGTKTASQVSVKPPIKIAPELIISTEEMEKLVAMGPQQGKYTLVDCRPVPRVQEGMIPTAINIPYPAFDKMTDRLPQDKKALLIFYCNGVTCNMSPASSDKARRLGYTSIKVYRDGMPEWVKRNYAVLSGQYLKEAWIDKDVPHVLLDVRSAKDAEKGFIKGAVTLPSRDVTANIDKFPPKDMKPPIMIYDQNGGVDAQTAAKALLAAGYSKITLVSGGFDAWKAAGYPVEVGKLAVNIAYAPKPRPGEMAIDEFKKIITAIPANTMVLDVRNQDEAAAGMIAGATNIPDEEILDRLSELPKDKLIITHCSTGVRAEMAYHKLKGKGYNVKFMNAKVDIDKDGRSTIEKP
jgi:rhodanese-related sulfurtransferase